jgi:hypothetical protein
VERERWGGVNDGMNAVSGEGMGAGEGCVQFTPVDAEAVYERLATLLEERIRVLEELRSAQAAL